MRAVAGLGRLEGSGGEGPSTVIFRHAEAARGVELELVGTQADAALLVVGVHGCDGADQDDAAIEARVRLDHVLDQLGRVQPNVVADDAPRLIATKPVRSRDTQRPLIGAPEVLVGAVPPDLAQALEEEDAHCRGRVACSS
eukprot:scaffold74285_cov72-Phaeocystis_antarctica.AAC.3